MLRACWRHFGRITFDALAFPRLDAKAFDAILDVEGIENLRDALAPGRGALVFSAYLGEHLDNDGTITLPSVTTTNPLLNRRLMDLRGGAGNAVILKRRAVKESLRALARGSCVAILIDQDAGADGVFVPFFGRLAATTPTLALLALRTEAPIVPLFSRVATNGTISVHIGPVVPMRPTGDRDADVLRLTTACTAVVEGWARRNPEQWLWMHRRWKTRPPGESVAGA